MLVDKDVQSPLLLSSGAKRNSLVTRDVIIQIAILLLVMAFHFFVSILKHADWDPKFLHRVY